MIAELERRVPAAEIIISCDRYRTGKGATVWRGVQQATGDVIAVIDADMDIAPRMLLRLLPFIEDYDIVVASKQVLCAPLQRKVITRLSRIYLRALFGVPVDTQTGLKVFRAKWLKEWAADGRAWSSGYLYDVQILASAVSNGATMIEIPVPVCVTRKVPARVLWRCLRDSWVFFLEHIKGY